MDPAMMAALLGGAGGGAGGPGGGGGGFDPSMLAGLAGPGGLDDSIWDMPMIQSIAFHPSRCEPERMDATDGSVRDGLFDVSGGDKVSYRLYLPPSGEATTLIYFWHGNAEVCTNMDFHKEFFFGCNAAVLSLDYRGYAWGTGQPSLKKICADAEACFAASIPLLERAGVPATAKRVAMSRSIGATCAVHMASQRASKFHGLIVDSGLMSIKGLQMAQSLGPMVCGGPDKFAALKEPFDTYAKLSAISCPLLVMHGRNDEIIPVNQAEQCHHRCASSDKTLKLWDAAGHNDVHVTYDSQWKELVTDFLGKVLSFDEPFPAGALVEAHSLSAAALNGLQGRVLGPQPGGERYRVDFGAEIGEKALKPDNLKVIELESSDMPDAFPIGAEVEAHSLSKADFNGLRGKVLGPKGERVKVEFPEPHGVNAIKPANLKLV